MKTYWIILAVVVAFAIGAWWYFRNKKQTKKQDAPPASDTDVDALLSQIASGLGGGAMGADITGLVAPNGIVPVREVVRNVPNVTARLASKFLRPSPTGTVTTPSGNTATFGRNPNAPVFN